MTTQVSTTSQFIGSIPEAYDRHLGPVLFRPYAADVVARVDAARSKMVLEIACGTGIVTRELIRHLSAEARLVASDLNQAMVDCARANVPDDPRVEWRVVDAMVLPFPDASFDTIVCQFGVMFLPDKVVALREAARVLQPGAVFHFNSWDEMARNAFARITHDTLREHFPEDPPAFYLTPFGYSDPDAIRADLAAADFRDVRIERVERDVISPSAYDLAIGLVKGNPVSITIQERGGNADAIVQAVASNLAAHGGSSPYRDRLSAWVVTART